ncbi:hypothetical protein DM02DRAFT_693378 [Periconia macrospinosa]|uniref:Retrovirus-related Pol polyprotein from transposon TNT 1-94-like beta-barrel domain-containing protein n=1 Tax=Periconia macrospinosa TaxID=97972 RepID=A0A2V1DAY9_9PLEO|nr:hypothetical protein DM02DRAFT_693378 [Periconia macrospinosa]
MAAYSDIPLCPTWACLTNSNVHVAKDRGWFKTYTPFTSQINTTPLFASSTYLPVNGIGTVEIPTRRSPNRSGEASHGSILLHGVLHVPDSICNFISIPKMLPDGCVYSTCPHASGKSKGTIKDRQDRNKAYFDPDLPLSCIKVRGYPVGPKLGPHTLHKGVPYLLGCHWEPTEQQKWLDFQAGNAPTQTNLGAVSAANECPPYTDEEKAYLKKHWRSEYHFLLQHGLHIHKEEDREEGRRILRAMMAEEASEEESEDDAFGLLGHQADYNSSERNLDWAKKHYGNRVCYVGYAVVAS